MKIYDDALIVVTSDHGEEFVEHGVVGWHSHTLHRELLRVPFLLKLPGSVGGGTRIESMVRSLDIAPSILGALGLEPPASFAGQDLLGGPEHAEGLPAVSELDNDQEVFTVSLPAWKLYDGMLFDLRLDPWEQQPLDGHSRRRRELEELAAAQFAEFPASNGVAVVLPEDALRGLEALGYVDD